MALPDKQFQFWRILVALAHEDHKVTPEERDFIVSKFQYIDFSEKQKSQLLSELESRQGHARPLFEQLDVEARAECLHMIHTLFTLDDEFNIKEQQAYKNLKDMHMQSLNQDAIAEDFRSFLEEQKERKILDEAAMATYRDDYDLFSVMSRYVKNETYDPYTDRHFIIWRVLIALAHADNKITTEERRMLMQRIETLDISSSQKETLLKDIEKPQDAIRLFDSIQKDSDQAECLYLAHALFGIDGKITPEEEIMYSHLKNKYIANNLS